MGATKIATLPAFDIGGDVGIAIEGDERQSWPAIDEAWLKQGEALGAPGTRCPYVGKGDDGTAAQCIARKHCSCFLGRTA